jgi:hypothetical protein
MMPIADSTEHTPAMAVTLRLPPGADATPAELVAAGSPVLDVSHVVLQSHPAAVPVSNDRISLEGQTQGGGRTGRTGRGGGGGGGYRGRFGGGRGRGRGRGRSPERAAGVEAAAAPAGGEEGSGGAV